MKELVPKKFVKLSLINEEVTIYGIIVKINKEKQWIKIFSIISDYDKLVFSTKPSYYLVYIKDSIFTCNDDKTPCEVIVVDKCEIQNYLESGYSEVAYQKIERMIIEVL